MRNTDITSMISRITLQLAAIGAASVLTFEVARAQTQLEKLISEARRGRVESQVELADLYRYGFVRFSDGSGVEKNIDEAERWLKEAVPRSNRAKATLAGIYSSYDFPRRNDAAAAQLLAAVAHSGDADKELMTGVYYALGELLYQECTGYLLSLDCGTNKTSPSKNLQAAAGWFAKAAAEGHREAQFELATMYEAGRGVPQDFLEAAGLYKKAADSRHEQAAVMLGKLYERMDDNPSAYMWFNLAAADDRYGAAERRDTLARMMTPAQIAAGQKLTREYRASREKSKRQ